MFLALHLAAFMNAIGCMKILLEGGANPKSTDNEGNTALHKAAQAGHSEAGNSFLMMVFFEHFFGCSENSA